MEILIRILGVLFYFYIYNINELPKGTDVPKRNVPKGTLFINSFNVLDGTFF